MNFTNAQILAAILTRWLQPAVNQILASKMISVPFLAGLENKIRASGWVRPSWSLISEMSPLLQGISSQLLEPFIAQYLAKVPDQALPAMAHSIVDNAIKTGELILLDGNVTFQADDLKELKKLLDYNLPVSDSEHYELKTDEDEIKK